MTAAHEHRFGLTWLAVGGLITQRWCVDCRRWVELDVPIPVAESRHFTRELRHFTRELPRAR